MLFLVKYDSDCPKKSKYYEWERNQHARLRNAFSSIIIQSIISFADLCHQEAAWLSSVVLSILVAKPAEEAGENTFSFSIFIFCRTFCYALVFMHHKSCLASQTIILVVFASSAGRFTIHAFVIQGYPSFVLAAVPEALSS